MKRTIASLEKHSLWEHKPLLKNSLLIWDIDNISIKALSSIKHLAKFTPEISYVVAHKPIDEATKALLYQEGFTLLMTSPLMPTDAKIVTLIDTHHHCSHLLFISSDGDFVPAIKRFLTKRSVQWIMQDSHKKRICMNCDVTHSHLTLSTLLLEDEPSTKKHQKRKKPAFYAPTRTSFSNEAYWLSYFARYHAHIG